MLPSGDEKRVVLNLERIKHWLKMGAQPTDRVARFLDAAQHRGALALVVRQHPHAQARIVRSHLLQAQGGERVGGPVHPLGELGIGVTARVVDEGHLLAPQVGEHPGDAGDDARLVDARHRAVHHRPGDRAGGARMRLVRIINGGHTWPGPALKGRASGRTPLFGFPGRVRPAWLLKSPARMATQPVGTAKSGTPWRLARPVHTA